jgi:hypothetical protein
MSKPVFSLSLPIANYPVRESASRSSPLLKPGVWWRKDTFDRIRAAADKKGIRKYTPKDRLKVTLLFYLTQRQMEHMDVDNLVKHVGDALQGKLGSITPKVRGYPHKKRKDDTCVLPNDWQISKWVVEKRLLKSRKLKSRLLVQRYRVPA